MASGLTGAAISLIADLGYWGLSLGLVADGLGAPLPSEVLIPLAVVASEQGHMSLWAVAVLAMVAQLVGAGVSFAIGRRWGLGVVSRYVSSPATADG